MSPEYELKRCAHCGTWIPATAGMCASCGTSDVDGARARASGARAAPPRRARAAWWPRNLSVTNAIILVNVGYFLWTMRVQAALAGPEGMPSLLSMRGFGAALYMQGAYIHEGVAAGEWWRIVAATFLHGGLLHIGMNMFTLRSAGALLEELVGPARFLTIYLVSGICSTLAISVWFTYVLQDRSPHMMVGASGAIFGVLGTLAVMLRTRGRGRAQLLGRTLLRDIVFMLIVGFLVPIVSNTGHVGGLLPGMAFGFFVGSSFAERPGSLRGRAWTLAATLLVAFAALSLGAGFLHSLPR